MTHLLREWRGKVYRTGQAVDFFLSDEWMRLRRFVLKRDNYICLRCDDRYKIAGLTCHHLMPRAEGGSDDPSNLVTLCTTCHDYVEIQGLRTSADIIGSYGAPIAPPPGKAAKFDQDDDPYRRPEWHRYVYGGRRHSKNR